MLFQFWKCRLKSAVLEKRSKCASVCFFRFENVPFWWKMKQCSDFKFKKYFGLIFQSSVTSKKRSSFLVFCSKIYVKKMIQEMCHPSTFDARLMTLFWPEPTNLIFRFRNFKILTYFYYYGTAEDQRKSRPKFWSS